MWYIHGSSSRLVRGLLERVESLADLHGWQGGTQRGGASGHAARA